MILLIFWRVPLRSAIAMRGGYEEPEAARAVLRGWGVKGDDRTLDRLATPLHYHALSVTVLGSYLGKLWAGEVGQNMYEEINIIEKGGNYGWNAREGAHCFMPASGCETEGLTDPVAEYGHEVGFSITGGYVYRGGQSTVNAGRYVFGDFGGLIASLAPDGAGGLEVEPLSEQGCPPGGAAGTLQISSFAEDLDGELYLLDYGSGQILGLEFTD